MPELTGPNSPALGFLLALAIGFLVGRTREPGPDDPPRPGMRDFLIIALLGAVAGHVGNPAIAIALFAGTIGALLVLRVQHPERSGITTELAAAATFVWLACALPRTVSSAPGSESCSRRFWRSAISCATLCAMRSPTANTSIR